jgi:hypothetical protein
MNRLLHLYMLETSTPYLFKSNRRKTFQEYPSAKERSLMLKTLKTVYSLYTLCIEKSNLYLWLKICICRTTAVRKVQYSDLFFRLHGIRHTLNCTQYTLSISYLNTQNWKVLLIFTVKRFVSVAKNMYPLKRKGKLSLDLLKQQFQYFISFFATEYTDVNAKD